MFGVPVRNGRRFVLVIVIVLAQCLGLSAVSQHQRIVAQTDKFRSFSSLSQPDFQNLVLDYAETPVPLVYLGQDQGGSRQYELKLQTDGLVILTAFADEASVPLIHPLILQVEGGPRFLLPLIRSAEPGRVVTNSIILGRFSAGQHALTLHQDASMSLPLPGSFELVASVPATGTVLAEFMEHQPAIKLKDADNLLDDIPMVSYATLTRHPVSSRYLVVSHVIFSSENGGTLPAKLYRDTGRTWDDEWMMRQEFAVDGQVVLPSRLFQGSSHRTRQFTGQMLGQSPVLTIATANNNFSDGRIHWFGLNVPNPFEASLDQSVLYRGKPSFFRNQGQAQAAMLAIPELQQVSWYELAREGCFHPGNLDDPVDARFMAEVQWLEQHQPVVFPDRGCRYKDRLSMNTLAADFRERTSKRLAPPARRIDLQKRFKLKVVRFIFNLLLSAA